MGAEPFTVFDWTLALVAAGVALSLLALPRLTQDYPAMLKDFGAGPLPWLTRVALTGYWQVLLGIFLLVLGALGLRGARSHRDRRAVSLVIIVVATTAIGLSWYGLNLPLREMLSNIR